MARRAAIEDFRSGFNPPVERKPSCRQPLPERAKKARNCECAQDAAQNHRLVLGGTGAVGKRGI